MPIWRYGGKTTQPPPPTPPPKKHTHTHPPPPPPPAASARAARRFSSAAQLAAAGNLLNWDARTHMPAGGAWARGEEMAALTEVIAGQMGSPAAGGELDEAEAMAGALTPGER